MPNYDKNNVFARILRAETPCTKVFEDEHVLAFQDIQPQAPVHVVVIPKGAYVSLADFSDRASADEIVALIRALGSVARQLDLPASGYRTIANTGGNARQDVPHLHFHILGGADLGPMLSHDR